MPSKYFSCIVPGCENNGKINPQGTFFHLPRTVNILEKWARNLNIPDVLCKPESSRMHYKVCGMHFVDSCFQTPEKKKLNRGVVPTIFNLERDLILPEGIGPCQGAMPVCPHELSPTTQALPDSWGDPVTTGPAKASSGAVDMPPDPLRTPEELKNTVIQEKEKLTKFVIYKNLKKTSWKSYENKKLQMSNKFPCNYYSISGTMNQATLSFITKGEHRLEVRRCEIHSVITLRDLQEYSAEGRNILLSLRPREPRIILQFPTEAIQAVAFTQLENFVRFKENENSYKSHQNVKI